LGWMVNVILPALTGQVARSFMLSKKQNLAKASSFASIALEVVFDGLSLLLLMVVVSYMFAFPSWLIRGEYTLAISVSLGLAFLYFLTHNQKLFSKLKVKFPHKVTEKIDQISHSFSQGLQMLKSSKHIVLVTLFSILSWLFQIAVVTLLLLAFNFKIPVWSAVVIIIINALMMMFPLTPGNIGTFQVATILGLSFFDVHKTEALSFGLVLHSLDILPFLFLGNLFLYLRKF
ncbi:MAG TPA: lysylphosphatidylglycerol synthase transmembrane domain-containing protein, partial [candidate division Zixibacteria bacterium]|nr:lysylphosphatidylglycerol synthase transmembrane domain-containing protein [candidate division Zixibacteria bacterium]